MNVPLIDVTHASPESLHGEIKTLKELAIAIREVINCYPYYVIVSGFPPHKQPEYLITLARGIGAAMDLNPTTTLLSEDLVSFTEVSIKPEKAEPGGDATRYSRTHLPLNPHTDSSYQPFPHELVAFQCIAADEQGGETVMVPIDDILQHLDCSVAALLREPVYPFGRGRYAILSGHEKNIQIRYYRTQIEHSLALESKTLSEPHQSALVTLDTLLEQLAPSHQFHVKSGQILFMHNHKVLHGRTGLSTESDRLLYRIRFYTSSLQTVEPTIADDVNNHVALARQLEHLERIDDANQHYRRASELTDSVEGLNAYGDFLLRRGQFTEAIALFRQSVALEPTGYDSGLALSSLANSLGYEQEAQETLKQVLRYHPHRMEGDINPQRPTILRLRGFEGATYSILPRESGLHRKLKTDGTFKTLLRGGHFSIDHLLDGKSYNFQLLNIFEDNVDELEAIPAFDLILNTIACPDSKRASLLAAARFVDRYPNIPLINHPRLVLETTRERNSIRLNMLPGVTFPKTEILWWDGISVEQMQKNVFGLGFIFPMIVREVGTQTGKSVVLIQNPSSLRDHFRESPANKAYYVIQYSDCSIQPSLFHKMRLFFIEGKLYPIANVYHDNWNIHSGDRYSVMIHQEWMQNEEKAFLSDPYRYLGRNNIDKLYAIRDLIQLDFFGIDFSILEDGTLFVFELNAAMRHNFDHAGNFPYTKPYLEIASSAFNQMVRDRLQSLVNIHRNSEFKCNTNSKLTASQDQQAVHV
jgi:alpha-ketoglutarate-dependent taurine dioxygenase